jgi:uncharacterized protein (DUF433 family)
MAVSLENMLGRTPGISGGRLRIDGTGASVRLALRRAGFDVPTPGDAGGG